MSLPLTIEDMTERFPGTSRQSWAQMRFDGTGPAFFKVGRRVFYRLEDVTEWVDGQVRTRTDDTPQEVA